MNALVVGGAASGKSAFAEQLACRLSPDRMYLATMANDSAEAAARVERHRAQRTSLGFATVEACGTLRVSSPSHKANLGPEGGAGLERGAAPKSAASSQLSQTASEVVLVDDVGNLVSNALFDAQGAMADATETLNRLVAEFDELCARHAHVVVVGNLVGASGQSFDDASGAWVRLVGDFCCACAQRCDAVVEVVAGVPCVLKGAL